MTSFKKGEFNFVRGWEEWASPAYEALPKNIRDLVRTVHEDARDLRQNPDLDMPWPSPEVRSLFAELPAELLAEAARIVHYYGHWAPSRHWVQTTGAYWKFSNYADQILSERLGLSRDRRDHSAAPHGASFAVHEGVLRLRLSTPDSWTWLEIGLATEEVRRRFEELMTAHPLEDDLKRYRGQLEAWSNVCRSLAERYAPEVRPKEGFIKDSFDFSRFLVKE